MTNYIEMTGGKKVAIQNEKAGTYRVVNAKNGKHVMGGFDTVRAAVAWTKINWN